MKTEEISHVLTEGRCGRTTIEPITDGNYGAGSALKRKWITKWRVTGRCAKYYLETARKAVLF